MLNINGRSEDGGGDLAIREMSVQSIGIVCGDGGKLLLTLPRKYFQKN